MGNFLELNRDILKKALDITKAVNSPDNGWITGVANILEQEEIQREVMRLVDYRNPLRQNLPRLPGSGTAYRFTHRTAGTTAGQFVTDSGKFLQHFAPAGELPGVFPEAFGQFFDVCVYHAAFSRGARCSDSAAAHASRRFSSSLIASSRAWKSEFRFASPRRP